MLQVLDAADTLGDAFTFLEPIEAGKIAVFLSGRNAETWGLQAFIRGTWLDVITGKDNAHDIVDLPALLAHRLKISAAGPKGFIQPVDGAIGKRLFGADVIIRTPVPRTYGNVRVGQTREIRPLDFGFEFDPGIPLKYFSASSADDNHVTATVSSQGILRLHGVNPTVGNEVIDITFIAWDEFGRGGSYVRDIKVIPA